MLKLFALLILALIAIVLIYAAARPGAFHVERSIMIKARPEKIFPLINDFHLWDDWTPYNKDPAMKKNLSGAPAGPGATLAWEGNKEVGKGEISITKSAQPHRVELDLHMIEPFEGRNQVAFTLEPKGEGTSVVWAMDGTMSYPAKLIGLFMDMDKMVGGDFEVGLSRLKTLAEKN